MFIINSLQEKIDDEDLAFQIILHAGNAKSLCMEAISAARENNFEVSDELFKQAAKELEKAHNCQTDTIRRNLLDKDARVNLLMIHAQDHVMNAITLNDLALEIVRLYKR